MLLLSKENEEVGSWVFHIERYTSLNLPHKEKPGDRKGQCHKVSNPGDLLSLVTSAEPRRILGNLAFVDQLRARIEDCRDTHQPAFCSGKSNKPLHTAVPGHRGKADIHTAAQGLKGNPSRNLHPEIKMKGQGVTLILWLQRTDEAQLSLDSQEQSNREHTSPPEHRQWYQMWAARSSLSGPPSSGSFCPTPHCELHIPI